LMSASLADATLASPIMKRSMRLQVLNGLVAIMCG
jgi:hypothetical protein